MDAVSSGTSQASRARSNRGVGIVTAADSRERSLGQLHVYDGEGKGKSQAALGVVLRTIGLGICEQRRTRVLLLRFLKGTRTGLRRRRSHRSSTTRFPSLN